MQRISVEQRRALLAERHRLARPTDLAQGAVEGVVDDLVVLHATDPATIFLSVGARVAGVTVGDIEAALFERRTLLRTLAMRRTLFVASLDALPVVERSSSIDVAAVERRRLLRFLSDSGLEKPDRWLADVSADVLDALGDEGRSARELTSAIPSLGTKITMGAGTKNAVEAGATSRVLALMAVEGLLARGRPAGNWTGRQYRWHRRDRWLANGAPPPDDPTPTVASSELVRRWLARFGPGTLTDIAWWTGWTKTKTRAALAAIDPVEVSLGGETTGFVLPDSNIDDLETFDSDAPWATLLPSLDPTPMGWKERGWFLGEHERCLFDRNGNIGPTVWVDGRIVGGWSQQRDGAVVVELLEAVGTDHRALIDREVERVTNFVGDVVVKPSFPTPLQKKLSAS